MTAMGGAHGGVRSRGADLHGGCQTEIRLGLSLVNERRIRPFCGPNKLMPASRAIRSSSEGHMHPNGAENASSPLPRSRLCDETRLDWQCRTHRWRRAVGRPPPATPRGAVGSKGAGARRKGGRHHASHIVATTRNYHIRCRSTGEGRHQSWRATSRGESFPGALSHVRLYIRPKGELSVWGLAHRSTMPSWPGRGASSVSGSGGVPMDGETREIPEPGPALSALGGPHRGAGAHHRALPLDLPRPRASAASGSTGASAAVGFSGNGGGTGSRTPLQSAAGSSRRRSTTTPLPARPGRSAGATTTAAAPPRG